MQDAEARARVARVEALLEEVESGTGRVARDEVTEVVSALLDLYGEGLARIVDRVADVEGPELAEALAADELVSHLLLLHDLHPVDLDHRVRAALAEVRPYLESHGGDVELVGVEEGVVRLRLQGSCEGCPSSAMTLKLAIEDAIHKAAPDVEAIEADGTPAPRPEPKLVQLTVSESLGGNGAAGAPGNGSAADWSMAGGLSELAEGRTVVKDVAGRPVLFLRLDGTFYSYRPECPGCHRQLDDADLSGGELACRGCANHYDVRRAGRCLDAPQLHLEPIPLLVSDDGLVKVATGAAA